MADSLPVSINGAHSRLEKKLNKVRNWDALASTPSLTAPSADLLLDRLSNLGDLYQVVEGLLQMQSSHHGLVQDRIWLEQELDGSLGLLDVIGTARNDLLQMKEFINNIQSSLRRRSGSETMTDLENKIFGYLSFKKKMTKEILKGFKELKRVQDKSKSSPLEDRDQNSNADICA